MSNETAFIFFVFVPTLVFGLGMTLAQRKFLRSFREIVNPDAAMSTEEVMRLFVSKIQKPEEFLKFLKNDFNNFPARVSNLYWQHYKNPILEKEASIVRKFIILAITAPAIGFIFVFLTALLK